MDTKKAKDLLGTSSTAFQDTGARKAFVDWLDACRGDLSRARCGQLGYHSGKLIDAFGAELPALVVADPETVAARLDGGDPDDPTCPGQHVAHRKRAARALHAWLHDLDPAATRAVMDHQPPGAATPQSPPPQAGAVDAPEPETAGTEHGMVESLVLAEAPTAFGFFEDAVKSQVALMIDYEGAVPDVREVGRDVLRQHGPATRRTIAFELADAFDVAVDLPATARTTLTTVCDEVILSVLEKRGVEIMDVPLQKR